jgi:hypothetical protein
MWTPDIVGCVCFLVASALAWKEYTHHYWWVFHPRHAGWWVVVLNVLGSVAFFISGIYAYVGPGGQTSNAIWLDGLFTFVGAVCFLAASFIMILEVLAKPE